MNNIPCQNEYDLNNYEIESYKNLKRDEYYLQQFKKILDDFYRPEKMDWIVDSLENLIFDAALINDLFFDKNDFKDVLERAFECDRFDVVLFLFNLQKNKSFKRIYRFYLDHAPSLECFDSHNNFLPGITNEEFLYWFSNESLNYINKKED